MVDDQVILTTASDTEQLTIVGAAWVNVADGTVTPGVRVDTRNGHNTIRTGLEATDLEYPRSRVIDGSGLFVSPGLHDCHVHYGNDDEGILYVANGVTAVRNMWGTEALLRSQRDGVRVLRPRILTTGPVLDGPPRSTGATWPGLIVCGSYDEGVDAANRQIDAGYPMLKVYANLEPAALAGICDAARERGVMVVGHCPDVLTFEEAARTGMSCIEHLENVENGHLYPDYELALRSLRKRSRQLGPARTAVEAIRIRVGGIDWHAIERMADELAGRDVAVCPTLVVYRNMFQSPEVAVTDPNLQYVPAAQIERWQPRRDSRLAPLVPVWPEIVDLARARFDTYLDIVALMHSRGVRIVAGTDAPNPYLVPGFSIHEELSLLVTAGVSPVQAIRCATTAPARQFGRFGNESRPAGPAQQDLLLLAANPLESLRCLRRPSAVLIRGAYLSRRALDGLLDGQRKGREAI